MQSDRRLQEKGAVGRGSVAFKGLPQAEVENDFVSYL